MKAPAICNFKRSRKWSWISNFLLIPAFFVVCTFSRRAGAAPGSGGENSAAPVFRLHLSNEPSGLDPQRQKSSSSSYLLGNLYRNLLKYDDQKGLLPDLAESCKKIKKKTIECRLKKNLKWSDGSPLTSADFLRTYRKILSPNTRTLRADLLFPVENAQAAYEGKNKIPGISAPTPETLRFQLTDPSRAEELLYAFSGVTLSPSREDLKSFNGPYRLVAWEPGHKIRLEKNPFYPGGAADRPAVEFLFIEEDSVALQLYEKNELQLLRRLPTLYIPRFKDRADFHWIPVTRFDYLGFGPELKDQEFLREALSESLRYPELQKIFSSYGVPGCAGLPASWFEKNEIPCFHYDEASARKALQKVSAAAKEKSYPLLFSSLGGEDHKRATEWMQSQWAQQGLKINPVVRENKVFLSEMNRQPWPLFRKGIAVDRPECLAALEVFSADNPENFLRLKDPAYEKILKELRLAPHGALQQKLCTQGVRFLMDHHLLIPLGGFDFAMLIKTNFAGWRFNQMNQLDLADLHALQP